MDEELKEKVEEPTNTETSKSQTSEEQKGFSITSMILGIVSLVLLFIPSSASFLLITGCGVLAIIFGIKGKKLAGVGMAKAGFIMGVIALSLEAALLLFSFALGAAIVSALF